MMIKLYMKNFKLDNKFKNYNHDYQNLNQEENLNFKTTNINILLNRVKIKNKEVKRKKIQVVFFLGILLILSASLTLF